MPILLLLLLPFVELYTWYQAGQHWGWGNVVVWEVITFIWGSYFVRRYSAGLAPAPAMTVDPRQLEYKIRGVVGGFLLLTPGLVTDAIGISLLLPGIGHLWTLLLKNTLAGAVQSGRIKTFVHQWPPAGPARPDSSPRIGGDDVIDVEYTVQNNSSRLE